MAGYSVTYSVVDNATKQIDAINKRIAQMRAPVERMSKSVSRFVDVSGLRKVAQGFDYIWKAAGSVLRTLVQIVPVLGTITGAATLAGMVKLVQSYASWSQELVRTASSLGTTTQTLQQFEDATRLAGGNAADMRQGLKGLFDTLADFKTGQGAFALTAQWANQLKINLRDANGQVRKADELFPELIQKLADMQNPADRAAASIALLGAGGDKLVESFRQSSKPFAQWLKDVERYKDLTDEQKRSLQLFTEAQGRLGVGVDRLGQQISVMMAEHFTPLMDRLAEFVEKHTPEILAAVDDISARFAAWLSNPETVKSFTNGVNSLIDSLKWVVNHLDEIKIAAEAIAALFVVKWGVGIVQAIASVTTAIGSMAGGGAAAAAGTVGGVGLLGSLAMVASVAIGTYLLLKKGLPALFGDRPGALARPPDEQGNPQSTPNTSREGTGGGSGTGPHHAPHPTYSPHGGGPRLSPASYTPDDPAGGSPGVQHASFSPAGGAGGSGPAGGAPSQVGGAPPPGPMNLPQGTVARGGAITQRLASDLNLSPDQASGITGNLQAESGLRAINEKNPLVAGSRGGFGWAQWTGPRRVAFEKYARDNNLDPKSDEANYGYLKKELQSAEYAPMLKQLGQLKGPDAARASAALFEKLFERPKVSNAGVRGRYAEQFAKAAPSPGAGYKTLSKDQLDLAPPVTVPPATVNAAVDVSITHNNSPPNSAVTATGSGSVNVAPVRVEHQDMADI